MKAKERLCRCPLCQGDFKGDDDSTMCPDCARIERGKLQAKFDEFTKDIDAGRKVERLDRAEIEQALKDAGHPIISAEFKPVKKKTLKAIDALPDEVADSQRFAVPQPEHFQFLDTEKIARQSREMSRDIDASEARYIKRLEKSAAISTVALIVSVLAMLLVTAILGDWSGFVYVASTTAVVCTWLGQASRALLDKERVSGAK